MPSKLFTLILEDAFRRIEWRNKSIYFSGKCLHHLRFANYIVIVANFKEELPSMIKDVLLLTKFITNQNANKENIQIENE